MHEAKWVRCPPTPRLSTQAASHLRDHGVSLNVTMSFLEMYEAFDTGRIMPEFPRGPETTTPTTLEQFARDVLAPALRAMEQHV